ncbi:MAG: hypothetical protein U0792_21975 [Gemmataceae bacterium]
MLLASGYIAGGTLCGLIIAFFAFLPEWFNGVDMLNLGLHIFGTKNAKGEGVEARRCGLGEGTLGRDVRAARDVPDLHRNSQDTTGGGRRVTGPEPGPVVGVFYERGVAGVG